MAKLTYADWLKEQNGQGAYAGQVAMNEMIRNTPETARGGYSDLVPGKIVQSETVQAPRFASTAPVNQGYDGDFNAGSVYGVYGVKDASTPAVGYAALATKTDYFQGRALDDASKARMKQNNPALYNQLVVQGIISPLAESKKTAPAPAPATATVETVEQKTESGAESPSAGETEQTGYAKYLAQHPEYAEADRRAESEYARSLPTYGALAEQMAQAGIHGGYGDYLQGVAYAQMQNAKADIDKQARAGYADYLAGGTTGANSKLYNLLRNGTYADEDGNTVQGYNLLGLTDEQYNAVKPTYAKDLEGMGYSPEQIDQAFSAIEATRAQNRDAERKRVTDAFTKYNSGETTATEYLKELGVTDEQIAAAAQNYAEQYKAENKGKEITAEEARDAVVGAAIIDNVDNARKEGLFGEGDAGLKVESEFLRTRLPMYGDEYDKTGWKDRGYMLAESIESAIDYKDSNMMTDADVQTVIDNALDAMFGNKPKEVQYVNTGNSVKITLDNGEVLKADYDGKASESASAWLNKNCANCPIAVYDGELYYKAYEKGNWMKLRTKGGITPGFNRGTPEQGDQYFKVIAYAMMRKNNYKAFKDEDTTYTI